MRKIALLCIAFFSFYATHAQRTLLIKNVNVVDVEKGSIIKNAAVLLRDSIITQVETKKTSSLKADTVIDGSNRYLIPGLWDMHTHIWDDKSIFPLLVANGVTGVRDMFEMNIAVMRRWSKEVADGKKLGPVVIAAGPIIDGEKPMWPGSVSVKTAEEGRRAVDSLKNILHTDFIKVYSFLNRESYFAVADEARKQQIPFAGHVPNQVTLLEAAKAGQKSIEHMYGFVEASLDSADHYALVRQKKILDTTLRTGEQIRNFTARNYNAEKMKQVVKEFKQYDSWLCPTMTVNRGIAYINDTTLQKDPRIKYVPAFMTATWNPANDFRLKSYGPEVFEWFKKDFDRKMQILKTCYDAGIPIIAGTDFPNPYCLPGFSLHDELQLMVKAGIPVNAALQTATINAAKYLGKEASYGSVANNKIADLVLLDANPLTDISNTTKISAVIVHGKVVSKAAIQEMLANAKKNAGHQ